MSRGILGFFHTFLGFVDRQKALNGFDLDDDATIHHEIQTVAAVDQDLLICDGKMFLSTHNTGNFHTLIPRALVRDSGELRSLRR